MTHDTFERLQAAWADLDRRVSTQETSVRESITGSRLRSVRRRLRPFAWGQLLQIPAGLACIVPAVAVETAGTASPAVLASAVVIHAYGVAVIAWAVATLVLVARIDPARPVLVVQERLLRLRRTYLAGSLVLGLLMWVLWLPFVAVVAAWLGADGYVAHLRPALPGMLGVSAAGLLGTLGLAIWARRRPRLRDRLLRLLSAGSLVEAEEELGRVVDLQRESP